MAVKVIKGQIWSDTISKNDVTRSIIFLEISFMSLGWYYAAKIINCMHVYKNLINAQPNTSEMHLHTITNLIQPGKL